MKIIKKDINDDKDNTTKVSDNSKRAPRVCSRINIQDHHSVHPTAQKRIAIGHTKPDGQSKPDQNNLKAHKRLESMCSLWTLRATQTSTSP